MGPAALHDPPHTVGCTKKGTILCPKDVGAQQLRAEVPSVPFLAEGQLNLKRTELELNQAPHPAPHVKYHLTLPLPRFPSSPTLSAAILR